MIRPDHSDVVAAVKADLQRRGVLLDGACGAFEITKRVAWQLRAEGAGLQSKTTGENCTGHATGILMYPDGDAFDILFDAGGVNRPQWNVIDRLDPVLYRPAIDPGDGVPVVVGGGDGEQHGDQEEGADIGALLADAIDKLVTGLQDIRNGIAAIDKRLADVQAKGIRANLNLRG